jgi:hypothetical protein
MVVYDGLTSKRNFVISVELGINTNFNKLDSIMKDIKRFEDGVNGQLTKDEFGPLRSTHDLL